MAPETVLHKQTSRAARWGPVNSVTAPPVGNNSVSTIGGGGI